MARCTATKSEDGGSCSPRVPCDGVMHADGTMTGGCGEPCDFVMDTRESLQVVLSYHHYRIQSLAAEHRAQIRATVVIRRGGNDIVVWSHSSSGGPFDANHIMPAARDFAAELAEILEAPITEVEQ